MKERRANLRTTVALSLWIMLGLAPGLAYSQENFYAGKTVTLIATTAPGGTGDLRVKAMMPFLKKHIPGNPTVVIQYMDGGGGRKGANHLFNSAKPDGLTIGAASGAIVGLAIMGEKGVSYDPDKFVYLGTPEHENHAVIYSRRELGLNSLEKLRAASGIRIGGQTVGHVSYTAGRLFAYFLDLKDPKFIAAYGGAELDPALERGEIDGRATGPDTLLQRNAEWLEKDLVEIHAIMETPKGEKHPHPRFGRLPEIETFAKSDRERKVIQLQRAFRVTGTPFVLPPGTPKDRVEILQEAFRKTYRDPEFYKEYKKLTADEPTPLLPENHEKAIREVPRDPEAIAVFKKLVSAEPLPPR